MTNDVVKPPHTVDGFEAYTDEVEGGEEQTSGRVIQGTLVKFTNEGGWITGGDEELSPGLELIVINIGRVVQRWQDGLPVETTVLEPGQKFPDIERLNEAVPQSEWEEGPDGKPRGPWQAQHIVYLLNPQMMDRYSYPTGTVGGGIAVRDLVDRTKWMRKFRGANVYPVITLSDVFMATRFGGRQRPHFEIKRWVLLDGGSALPAPELPQLESSLPTAQEVKPPSAKEAVDDSIPF
jgi:hypothetical protein